MLTERITRSALTWQNQFQFTPIDAALNPIQWILCALSVVMGRFKRAVATDSLLSTNANGCKMSEKPVRLSCYIKH